jgi:hypothetical protein
VHPPACHLMIHRVSTAPCQESSSPAPCRVCRWHGAGLAALCSARRAARSHRRRARRALLDRPSLFLWHVVHRDGSRIPAAISAIAAGEGGFDVGMLPVSEVGFYYGQFVCGSGGDADSPQLEHGCPPSLTVSARVPDIDEDGVSRALIDAALTVGYTRPPRLPCRFDSPAGSPHKTPQTCGIS